MKNEKLHREFERLINYDVQDQNGTKVGTVHSIWADDYGHNLFLSVKTHWLFGRNHVIPAHTTTVNDKQRAIRLPFSEAKIKDAPSFDEKADLYPADEDRIYNYFNLKAPRYPAAAAAETEILKKAELAVKPEVKPMSEARYTTSDPMIREGEATMKLSEEQLKIGKREVVAGGLRLHKIVRTEVVSQPVDLKREKFVVERVPASGKADIEFETEDVFIPLRREEAVVEKESHIREDVRIRKESFTEKETVSGEIRTENVEIDEKATDPRFVEGKEVPASGRYEAKERSRR